MNTLLDDGIVGNSYCFMPPEISPKTGYEQSSNVSLMCVFQFKPSFNRNQRSFRRGASIVLQNMVSSNFFLPIILVDTNCLIVHQVRRDTSVGQWLFDTRRSTEVECLNSLHAKEIAETTDLKQALAVRCAEVLVRKIRQASVQLINDLDDEIDKLPVDLDAVLNFQNDFAIIYKDILQLIDSCRKKKNFDDTVLQLASELVSTCESLHIALGDFISKQQINNPLIESHLRKIKEFMGSMVDHRIKSECQVRQLIVVSKAFVLTVKYFRLFLEEFMPQKRVFV